MSSIQISGLDWLVLIAYLLIIIGIGVAASLRVKNTDQYFLGNRRFGKWIMIAQSFGTGTHAEMPVSLAGIVYTTGLSGIWFQWKNLFVTPFYWLLAPLFRRFRRTTFSEVIEDRYGSWMGGVYTVFALLFFTINLASMLKGAAKVIDQAVGGQLSVNAIVVGMTCLFMLYSCIGGLLATAWTEFVQGFLIIVLSFMLLPLGWHLVGGLDGMRATLGAEHFKLAAPTGIGVGFVAVLTLNGLIGIVAQPHLIAAVGTGRDELTCRIGHMGGNLVKRFCTIGWGVVGLMAAAMVARGFNGVTRLDDPEDAFGYACRYLLFPGGVGLLVASFLAANMASCSSFMVDSGALVTNGLYRRHIKPGASDQHYLIAGRISGVLVTLVAVLYALFFIKRVLYSFLLTETMATYFGISVLGGLVWKQANRWGALASLVAALGANFGACWWRDQRLDQWTPGVFLFSLASGIVALIIVSLLTRPEPPVPLETFYANLRTPTDGEATTESSAALAQQGRQLLLVNLLALRRGAHGFGFWRAYRTDLKGFLLGWLAVLVLVAGLWLWIHCPSGAKGAPAEHPAPTCAPTFHDVVQTQLPSRPSPPGPAPRSPAIPSPVARRLGRLPRRAGLEPGGARRG